MPLIPKNLAKSDALVRTGVNCPFCGFPFHPGDNVVFCPSDSIPHHVVCWGQNGNHCTTLGCTGSGEIVSPFAVTPATAGKSLLPFLVGGVIVVCLIGAFLLGQLTTSIVTVGSIRDSNQPALTYSPSGSISTPTTHANADATRPPIPRSTVTVIPSPTHQSYESASTSTPTQPKTDVIAVVDDFGNYSTISSLRSVYLPNAAWGRNSLSLGLSNMLGIPTIRLDYNILGTSNSDNYIVLDRCVNPAQDWRGAQYVELWVQNDTKPKQLVLQFGEGIYCTPGHFPIEVWNTFVNLSSSQTGLVRVRLNQFSQETGWAVSQNNRMDLDTIGYFAIGIRGDGIGSGTMQFGAIRILR